MTKKLILLCLLLLGVIFSCNRNTDKNLYRVIKVKDGDTIEILSSGNQPITVRLAEIDCPEKTQAFGQKAKQFTSDLCFGKMVKISNGEKDRYGRTVATVELEDGTNVNYELVKNGYAWQYTAYSKSAVLAEMQQEAQNQHLGLWSAPRPTPPWLYRKHKKSKKEKEYDYAE
ncbi:thermonuclease family protein [Mucilaginibacter koreensis]